MKMVNKFPIKKIVKHNLHKMLCKKNQHRQKPSYANYVISN